MKVPPSAPNAWQAAGAHIPLTSSPPECPLHHNRTLCASLLRTSLALRLCVLRAGSAWEFPSLLGTALSQWLLVGEYKYPHFFI